MSSKKNGKWKDFTQDEKRFIILDFAPSHITLHSTRYYQNELKSDNIDDVISIHQAQAENYAQNNGHQPSSTHGSTGIGGPNGGPQGGGGQDLRHASNVTPIPPPVMGKHSSYNYRARNDGDPVVKVNIKFMYCLGNYSG